MMTDDRTPIQIPGPTDMPNKKRYSVPVSISEYQNLIACRVILDMLLNGTRSDHIDLDLADLLALFRAAYKVRELYL